MENQSKSRISALNMQFEGNMNSTVKNIQIDNQNYEEIIDFVPNTVVSNLFFI